MIIHRKQLPIDELDFRVKLAEYLAAREEHRATVGVPAPFPEYEIFRAIADNGGIFEIVDGDDPIPADQMPAPLKAIVAMERNHPFTHRALREFFIGFGTVNPQFQATLLYQRAKDIDDAIKEERAKL